jgi:glycerol kinase
VVREHEAEIRALTGLRLSPHYGATKLAWCLEHVPAVRDALHDGRLAFGPLAGFLAHRLLDERPLVVDASNASRTLLCDVRAGDWSPRLLDLFGVPRIALPRVAGTRDEFGTLDVGPTKVPLRVLIGDQSAAFLADGEPAPDVASVTFGTGAFVLRATNGTVPDVPGLLATLVQRENGRSTIALEGTINGAGSALAWLAREEGTDELADDLDSALIEVGDPPLFLNGVGGLAAPFWRPDFASRFVGEGDASARAVAVVESVVFLVVEILRAMEASQGPVRALRAGGGLARLDGLCTRLASLASVPVERHAETETTALGVARLLGATPRAPEIQRFEPTEDAPLGARHARWRTELAGVLESS